MAKHSGSTVKLTPMITDVGKKVKKDKKNKKDKKDCSSGGSDGGKKDVGKKDMGKFDRRDAKTKWKSFNDSLKRTESSEAIETYGNLSKPLKQKFRQAWERDPTWQFVEQYKSRCIRNVKSNRTSTTYRSATWLKRELGGKGAKKIIALAKKERKTKRDRAGNWSYEYIEDFEAG